MTSLDVLLGVAGIVVTIMVVAGMVLITPRGVTAVHAEGADPHGSNLSAAREPNRPERVPTSS